MPVVISLLVHDKSSAWITDIIPGQKREYSRDPITAKIPLGTMKSREFGHGGWVVPGDPGSAAGMGVSGAGAGCLFEK
jgi:hypothetical protein